MASRLQREELRAWRGFLDTHARIARELDAELQAAHRMPLSTYDVLVNLDSAPQRRLRMNELAEAIVLSRSGLTRLVDRLVADGLVEREPCDDDARGSFAVLTDRGKQLLEEARPTHHEGVRRRFLDALDDAEKDQLGQVWQRLLERNKT